MIKLFKIMYLTVLVCALGRPAVAKQYEDTKNRFALELAAGWQLAPVPLDTEGMVFKKEVDLSPGMLRVKVMPGATGDALASHVNRVLLPFKSEIGFKQESTRAVRINGIKGQKVIFTMFANGDARFVRRAQLNVLLAYGHVHVIYFECLQKAWRYFAPDLSHMLKRYEPRSGRDAYQLLVGEWADVIDGKKLRLGADNTFKMKHLEGIFTADGGQMVLFLKNGKERFRYRIKNGKLYLRNQNLGVDQVFQPIKLKNKTNKNQNIVAGKPPDRDSLYGKWRVVDQALAEPLTLFLSPTGSMSFGPMNGRWTLTSHRLSLTSVNGIERTYHISIHQGRMRMSGGDLDKELILVCAK
ncbi:MAG: hypothetical protein CMH56_05720 [Myxococcales bacterium]|nr:hypothetical protein [Myxococcales bacterium]